MCCWRKVQKISSSDDAYFHGRWKETILEKPFKKEMTMANRVQWLHGCEVRCENW